MTSKISAFNPFKGQASLVLRRLLTSKKDSWTGEQLAQELGISRPWCNKVLNALEKEGIVERGQTGLAAFTSLVDPQKLLSQWATLYRWSKNTFYSFIYKGQDPLAVIAEAAEREGWLYAATGPSVLKRRHKKALDGPETVYLSPRDRGTKAYSAMLEKIQGTYGFYKVQNNPDIQIVKPALGRSVFFEGRRFQGIKCVSPLQLYLDTHGTVHEEELIGEGLNLAQNFA